MIEKNQIWEIEGVEVCILAAYDLGVFSTTMSIVSYRHINPREAITIISAKEFLTKATNTGKVNTDPTMTILRSRGNDAFD